MIQRLKEWSQWLFSIFTIICGFASLFSWVGISADTVGEQAYAILSILWPAVVAAFFFASGYALKGALVKKKLAETKSLIEDLKEENARLAKCVEEFRDKAPSRMQEEQGTGLAEWISRELGGASDAALKTAPKLTKADFEVFKRICSISLVDEKGNPDNPVVVSEDSRALELVGLSWPDIESLEELGLLKTLDIYHRMLSHPEGRDFLQDQHMRGQGRVVEPPKYDYRFNRKTVTVNVPAETFATSPGDYAVTAYCIDRGVVRFTPIGREIASRIRVDAAPNVEEYIKAALTERNKADYQI